MTATWPRRCRASAQGRDRLVGELRPVRQPGEGVVHRVVAQPPDEHLVVQGDRGVVGDRLQQLHVAGREAAHLAHPVVHGERADGLAVVAQRGDARASSALRDEQVRRRRRRRWPHQQRLAAVAAGARSSPVARSASAGVELATRSPSYARHRDARRSPNRMTSAVSPRSSSRAWCSTEGSTSSDVGRDAELAAEPEQPLEAGVPVGQRGVGPVADHQHRAGGDAAARRRARRGAGSAAASGRGRRWRPRCRPRRRGCVRRTAAACRRTTG